MALKLIKIFTAVNNNNIIEKQAQNVRVNYIWEENVYCHSNTPKGLHYCSEYLNIKSFLF